jgi:hypothetical protein
VGFLDSILGRTKAPKGPAPDRLFAMATAYVKLSMEMGLETTGKAAIVFQPIGTADFDRIVSDMEEIVRGTGDETGTTVTKSDDKFGYRWMILSDPDMDDLVVGLNAVSTELQANGYGDRLLAAVFAFEGPVYWIYNYKRGTFYPFVPKPGSSEARDSERELRLKAQIGQDLPVEDDLARWFPLWGAPI